MRSRFTAAILLIAFSINGCGQVATPKNPALPTAAETAPPPPASTNTVVPIQVTELTPTVWKEVRDERFGFGIAVPCWWLIMPITPGGIGGTMIIKNYDDAYFNAHSNKGFWDWPNGTLKLDVIIFEGADPSKSDAEAYMANVDPTMEGLVSVETQQTGSHTATVLTLTNLINTNDPNSRVFIYRFVQNKLLLINPVPQSIIDTPDFQALLSSIVLSPEEQINLPTITPAPALIDASCAQ
jgi:hypothetical protein